MLKHLINTAYAYRKLLGMSFVCRIIGRFGSIAMLALSGMWLGRLLEGEKVDIVHMLLILFAIGIVKAAARYSEQVCGHGAAFQIQSDLRYKIYRVLERRAPDSIGDIGYGDLVSRTVADAERIEVFFAHTLVPLASALCLVFVIMAVSCLWVHPFIGLAMALYLACMGLLVPFVLHPMRMRVSRRSRKNFGQINEAVSDYVQGLAEAQGWGSTKRLGSRAKAPHQTLDRLNLKAFRLGTKQDLLSDAMIMLGFLAMCYLLISQPTLPSYLAGSLKRYTMHGSLKALGAFGALAFYMGSFAPFLELTRIFQDLPAALAACERLFALVPGDELASMSSPVEDDDRCEAFAERYEPSALAERTRLRVEQVHFRYPATAPVTAGAASEGDAPHTGISAAHNEDGTGSVIAGSDAPCVGTGAEILAGFSCEFSQGDHVLLSGKSGAGKSTLAKLLAGAMLPQSGAIRLEGYTKQGERMELEVSEREEWWKACSYVPQKGVILPGTLRTNLEMGLPQRDERLLEALKMVEMDEWFATLPEGFETKLGLMGSRVSGGEAQRIALARVILRNSPVYILDEAYAALDEATEIRVREKMQSFMQDKIVVEIAHTTHGLKQYIPLNL